MVGIQTVSQARMSALARACLLAIATLALSSCATMVEDQKRAALDRKCQTRVVQMLNTVSPVVAETDIPKKFCGCLTAKVDVVKLEKDIDEVKEISLNPETLKFVTEYIPTIRTCAKETGLWKGL
jgi:glycerol-3-phosphate cytidylyltransferase-like family protein